MTANEFVVWLSGFIEATGLQQGRFNRAQMRMVRQMLSAVRRENDPR